jgi:hypothetical protein
MDDLAIRRYNFTNNYQLVMESLNDEKKGLQALYAKKKSLIRTYHALELCKREEELENELWEIRKVRDRYVKSLLETQEQEKKMLTIPPRASYTSADPSARMVN